MCFYKLKNVSYDNRFQNYDLCFSRDPFVLACFTGISYREFAKLDKPLSPYVSRHTWATIALRKGIPVEIISESMGHENKTTTRIYLASLGQSVVDKANAEIIRLE
jgi:integrase